MNNLVEGIDFYYDDSGLMVFKQKYHLERGYCCGNGCRHCPYDYMNVASEKVGGHCTATTQPASKNNKHSKI